MKSFNMVKKAVSLQSSVIFMAVISALGKCILARPVRKLMILHHKALKYYTWLKRAIRGKDIYIYTHREREREREREGILTEGRGSLQLTH
jgi:hypothetical protein